MLDSLRRNQSTLRTMVCCLSVSVFDFLFAFSVMFCFFVVKKYFFQFYFCLCNKIEKRIRFYLVTKHRMGIKYLNGFLKQQCKDSIHLIPVSELSGKKIAVDISIYLYKYEAENQLIENMYLMLSIFHYYRIIPVFIFDGKPPNEKKDLLKKRREDKKTAEQEYRQLEEITHDSSKRLSEEEKHEINQQMDQLKKQFIYLTREKTEEVKRLIRSYGATYYDAPGEADELCAALVVKNKVWACLSEDMDMFVYGCTRVIRYLSLMNHTVVLYDTAEILKTLGLTQKELRQICILSGTDYHETPSVKSPSFHEIMKLFQQYRIHKEKGDFYEWIQIHTPYLCNKEAWFQKIQTMFELTHESSLKKFEHTCFMNGPVLREDMMSILKKDGFLFPLRCKG